MKSNIETKEYIKLLFIKRFGRFTLFLVFLLFMQILSNVDCHEVWLWLKSINITILAFGLVWLMRDWLERKD